MRSDIYVRSCGIFSLVWLVIPILIQHVWLFGVFKSKFVFNFLLSTFNFSPTCLVILESILLLCSQLFLFCFVLSSIQVCWVGFSFITQLSLNWDYMVDCRSIRIEYRVLVVQDLYFVGFGSQRLHIFTRLVGTKFSLKV